MRCPGFTISNESSVTFSTRISLASCNESPGFQLEGRIKELEYKLEHCTIAQASSDGAVSVGATVVIEYDDGAIKKEFVVNYNQFGSNTTLSGQINSGNLSVNNMLVESIIQAVSISQGDTTNSIAGLYDLDKEDFKYNGKAISYNQQTYIFSVQLNVNLLEDVRNNQVTDTPVKPEVDNKDENNQTVVTPSN